MSGGGIFFEELRQPSEEQCFVCLREGLHPAPLYSYGEWVTAVGCESPEGHDHDDNCHCEDFKCDRDHYYSVRKRNTCPACEWKGKEECFCHPLGVRIYHPMKGDIVVYAERVNSRPERAE